MKETYFSIKEVLRAGWEGWKQHWSLLIAVVAISFLLGSVANLGALFKDSQLVEGIFQVLGVLFGSYASLGIINVSLKIVKQQSVKLSDYFDTLPYFWRFLLGQIVYYVAVAIGLFFLIVPGVIIALKYYLFPYFIVEKNMGIIEAFKASNRTVYGSKSNLFLFAIIEMFIILLGLICLGVGLFIAIPVVAIAQAAIYKKLSSQLEEVPLVTEH